MAVGNLMIAQRSNASSLVCRETSLLQATGDGYGARSPEALDLLSGVDGHGCEAMPDKRIPSPLPTINLSNLLHKNSFRFSYRPEFPHMAV